MTTLNVFFTPGARRQLLAAVEFIGRDKPGAAARFHARLLTTLRRLADFPDSGRTIPEFPRLRFREVSVPPYRCFYSVESESVWIVGIWHSAQRPTAPGRQTHST
ncbi:MAG TPA: type II toxin-antitoxin system RelE/ParE family toxin [Myxococcota bacterium]|nr:type II toxin-antitoxin system RelE/ParE family toxin [Myxococcota bacterium]HOH76671.1 type II toxin-antitoxin system RelE/ParE family toxin [Myxococcota bacterium]HPV05025.1 type II toxin-antitoxin system RelE/ParE family toxin [Myxococcota bacterium]